MSAVSRARAEIAIHVLVYVSVVVVAWRLAEQGAIGVPRTLAPIPLVGALVCCLIGFLCQSWHWQSVLQLGGCAIRFRTALVSVGLPMLAKYVPGKVWSILGRVAYIAAVTGDPPVRLSALAAVTQVLSILTGLMVGSFALAALLPGVVWLLWLGGGGILLALTVVAMTSVSMGRPVTVRGRYLVQVVLRCARFRAWLPPVLAWLSWGAGFWLLALSLGTLLPVFGAVAVFAAAATAGILALVVPGGIGVREGAMVALLVPLGVESQPAAELSIVARMWFLTGEIVVFVSAVLLRRLRREDGALDAKR